MYLLAKIHKPKLKTRVIISYSGSLLEGLGQWVDKELKKIMSQLPYIAKDAVSMYANIHLGHALPTIMNFLTLHPKGLGLWTPLHENDLQRREEFRKEVSTFGEKDKFFKDNPSLKPLQWEVEDFSTTISLDLNIHLDVNGICCTSIYEKSLNLYLNILPHSCHAPGVTKSVIFRMVHRAPDYLNLCFNRFVRRGHCPSVIKPLFAEAIQKHSSEALPSQVNTSNNRPLVFQLPYNPLDPNHNTIQAAFKNCILKPPNEDHWSSLSANDTGTPPNINRLTVCYRRQPSLELRFSQDFSISQYYEKYQDMNPVPTT